MEKAPRRGIGCDWDIRDWIFKRDRCRMRATSSRTLRGFARARIDDRHGLNAIGQRRRERLARRVAVRPSYADGGKIPTTIGVRTRTHTYTRYTSQSPPVEQLFDNQSDPDQVQYLANDLEHRLQLEQLRSGCNQLLGEVR